MWTTTFNVRGADNKPISFVIKKDLSPSVIQEVMDEPIHILKTTGNMFEGINKWNIGLAARVIMEPREYRDNEDMVRELPHRSAIQLFNKLNEVYPFLDHVPQEYSGPLLELRDIWKKTMDDMGGKQS